MAESDDLASLAPEQRRAEREKRHRVLVLESALLRRPVVSALAEMDIAVEGPSHVARLDRGEVKRAMPVLFEFMETATDSHLLDELVSGLKTRYAKPEAAGPLITLYGRVDRADWHLRWSIASALTFSATADVFDDLVRLATDATGTRSREMLPIAIAKTKHDRALEVLVPLLGDDEIAGHVVSALADLRRPEARASIEPFLQHREPWVRRQARRAIRNFDKAEAASSAPGD